MTPGNNTRSYEKKDSRMPASQLKGCVLDPRPPRGSP